MPTSLVPGGEADSAGFPWAGRTFDHHDTAFAADDGGAPDGLREAVAALRAAAANWERAVRSGAASGATSRGVATAGSQPHTDAEPLAALAAAHADALLALSTCRLLVPLLAEAGDLGVTPEGRTVEKTQELSIVTIVSPDGRRTMPVFSSVETMRVWNPEARPIPVPAPQAAIAAAQEGTDLIIVDAGSAECELGVRRTQLEAVALARRALPPWHDADVRAAFVDSVAEEPMVRSLGLAPGDPEARLSSPETEVVLTLADGLDRVALDALVSQLQRQWAANEIIAERVDSMSLKLRKD